MTDEAKRAVDRTGGELRDRARSRSATTSQEAIAELERRRDNLRGAVVPAWERVERGQDPAEWSLW